MKSKTYSLENVGEVVVCKHHKSKSLSIKIRYNQPPKVVIPTLMSFETGYQFAKEKEAWIISSVKKLAENHTVNIITEFQTRFHKIKVEKYEKSVYEAKKTGSEITVQVPYNESVGGENAQERIRVLITNVLRMEAKRYLPARTQFIAEKYGFKFNQVRIKNQKSRWGSCSGKNNINLNLHLMRLPEYLSDFVILHELCHTVHKNHGAEFHKLLDTLTKNKKDLEKQLRNYTIMF